MRCAQDFHTSHGMTQLDVFRPWNNSAERWHDKISMTMAVDGSFHEKRGSRIRGQGCELGVWAWTKFMLRILRDVPHVFFFKRSRRAGRLPPVSFLQLGKIEKNCVKSELSTI